MGTGKSRIGAMIAQRLGMQFLDMDTIIVERARKPITRIFQEDGEASFREYERNLVTELSARNGLVIATGGGIVLNPHNIEDYSRTGLVVCLQASPEEILKRVGKDTNRPLLAGGDKMKKICDLLSKRQHLYDSIPNRIDTTGLTPEDVAERITTLYHRE